ncbi:3-isopropylmalate dehydratase large subunit-like [Brassica napus]|uniref:3-isopropylmalate dehydratase large subunit-like n=1 Tax=Brassica napus TaxID=3708 RepID=UPI002078F7D4|nr:3-isopropylmalate dehydratase large subunit-like [Brassica napus]
MGASEALTDTSSLYDVGNVEFSDTYTMLTVTNALASVQNRVFGDKAKANHDYKGVCHVAFAQEGHCRPGEVWLRTDSHACTAGAFGQFAKGLETLMQALC